MEWSVAHVHVVLVIELSWRMGGVLDKEHDVCTYVHTLNIEYCTAASMILNFGANVLISFPFPIPDTEHNTNSSPFYVW